MKTLFTGILFVAAFLLAAIRVDAQDSTKAGVVKQINASSENADKLHGKKLQAQSLSNHRFEKLGSIAADKPVKKKHSKKKRKDQ